MIQPLRAWPVRAAIALVTVGIVAYMLYGTTQTKPLEADRAAQLAGYSMIAPHGWVVIRDNNLAPPARDRLRFEPDEWRGIKPTMWARRIIGPPSDDMLKGYVDARFQDQPAKQRDLHLQHTTQRKVMIERGGEWFDVGVELPGLEAARMDDWWRFVETFQAAAGATRSTP